jgi:flavin-dependent dehydrogenase
MNKDQHCDVLIIGAGMAGGLLARQLTIEQPDLKLTLVDKKTDFDWHIGESTVEVFDDYAVRNCKLGPYLAANHIVKHGLRFWFDSQDKDLSMSELSEQGRSRYTTLNRGVQLDRSRFDRDLCAINASAGVDVRLGTRVLGTSPDNQEAIVINPDGMHRVLTSDGWISCRHLVDAGGRSAPLARQLNLEEPDSRIHTGSYWSRYAGTICIDELGDDAWRARVEGTMRWCSTNHFMYDGYWFWLIPLSADVVSIGVTFDRRIAPMKFRNAAEFTAFLRTHKCMDQLLGRAPKALDFGGLSRIQRRARQYFSDHRWYLTGMSGLFVDPLFSNSSAVIALSNRMIASMIEAERAGSTDVLRNRRRHFDIAMRNIYARQQASYDNYHLFGSFDAFVNWQTIRYHSILNYDIPAQHDDHRHMIDRVDSHLEACDCAAGVWTENQRIGRASDALAREFVQFLKERGQYYARNACYFHEKTERADTRRKTVELQFGAAEHRESLLNWECFVRYYIGRMCEIDGVPFDEPCFVQHFICDWDAGQSLGDILQALRQRQTNGMPVTPSSVHWDLKGPISTELATESAWWCRFTGPDGKQISA